MTTTRSDQPESPWLVRKAQQNAVSILLIVLAIVFIAQNREDTSVHLFWMSFTAAQWLVLAAMFLVGFAAGALRSRRRARARR